MIARAGRGWETRVRGRADVDVPRGVDHASLLNVAERAQANRAEIPLEHGPVPHRALVRDVRVTHEGGVGRNPGVTRHAGNSVTQRDLLTRPVVDFVFHEVTTAVVRARGARRRGSGSPGGNLQTE